MPLLQTDDTSYTAASVTHPALQNWLPAVLSADAELLMEHPALVARSRDLSRNNGVAAGAVQTLVDNIVGTGFTLNSRPDYRALGKTKEWANEIAIKIESKWRSWAESFDYAADRKLNFYGQTQLVCRTQFVQGEALALPLWLPERRTKYKTTIQLVDPDRLSTPIDEQDGPFLRAGIRIDRYGAPVSYLIRRSHPREVNTMFSQAWDKDWEEIPARTGWGRPRVLHIHDMARTGQSRGKPAWTASMPEFKTIDRYKTAELQAAVVNAMVAGVIESGLPAEQILEFFGGKVENYLTGRAEHKVQMKGGTIIPLYPGDKWSSHTPSRPNAQFGDFMESIHRHIGASIGLPLELLMKDFSQTNYSSARAALLEAWRFFGCRRDALITYWCDPIYQMWLEELIGAGGLEGVSLEEYLDDPIAWSRCGWIGDGRGWIDPLKEAQASEYRRKAGVSTLAREAAEQGLDWRDVQEDIVSEEVYIRDLREKAGLDPVPMDPLTKAKTEALTAGAQEDQAEAEETKKPAGRAKAEEKEE